ncbi:acryloyl-CoA reductase [Xylella taiwanensis]|nr:acryloyl-CoA reductase [Xylella taiwanensis]
MAAISIPAKFTAFRIHQDDAGHRAGLEATALDLLTPGEVVVRALWSSVNYKDALAGTGRSRILHRFPLTGGIDVAGYVIASTDPTFNEGDAVIATGCGLSETLDGGYSQYVRLKSQTLLPLPAGLSLREAMVIGTAGFTAALVLLRLTENHQTPALGPLVVTGATGGVGMLALDIFSGAGFEVYAVSSKVKHAAFLREIGATQVLPREVLLTDKPLASAHYGGGLDNVGGPLLAGLLAQTVPYGNIATVGLAASPTLNTTVMPFILRGVSLLGIGASGTARNIREQIWGRLAGIWRPRHLEQICTQEVGLDGLTQVFETMLAGGSFGRTVVRIE